MQKTYNRQTAKFLAVVIQNMPEMSGSVMQQWIENPQGLQNVLQESLYPDGCLCRLGEVNVSGGARFDASEFFTTKDSSVNIAYLNKDFLDLLTIEEGVQLTTLVIHGVVRQSSYRKIFDELGIRHGVIALLNLYELLCKQPKGGPGMLSTDGSVNICYIRGIHKLWTVIVRWDGSDCDPTHHGWKIFAYLFENTSDPLLPEGIRVISRK